MSRIFTWLGSILFVKGLIFLPAAPVLWPVALILIGIGAALRRD